MCVPIYAHCDNGARRDDGKMPCKHTRRNATAPLSRRNAKAPLSFCYRLNGQSTQWQPCNADGILPTATHIARPSRTCLQAVAAFRGFCFGQCPRLKEGKTSDRPHRVQPGLMCEEPQLPGDGNPSYPSRGATHYTRWGLRLVMHDATRQGRRGY